MSKLIDEAPLLVLPSLAEAIGLNEAMVLQQFHFLTQSRRGKPVEYTYKELRGKYFRFWRNEKTIQRAVAELRKRELVTVTQLAGTDRRNRYEIDYERVDRIGQDGCVQEDNLSASTGTDSPDGSGHPDLVEADDLSSSFVEAVNDRGTATAESEPTAPPEAPTSLREEPGSDSGGGADRVLPGFASKNDSQQLTEYQRRAGELLELVEPVLRRRAVARPFEASRAGGLTVEAVAAAIAESPDVDHLAAARNLAFFLEHGPGASGPRRSMASTMRKFVKDGPLRPAPAPGPVALADVPDHGGRRPGHPSDWVDWVRENLPFDEDGAHFSQAVITASSFSFRGPLSAPHVQRHVELRLGPYQQDAA